MLELAALGVAEAANRRLVLLRLATVFAYRARFFQDTAALSEAAAIEFGKNPDDAVTTTRSKLVVELVVTNPDQRPRLRF